LALICAIAYGTASASCGAGESGRPDAERKARHRLILANDGGTLGAPDMEAPIGIEGLVHQTIDPLRDTLVDTLYWQLGTDPYWGTPTHRLSDWYSHNTRVGTRWGTDRDRFQTAGQWRIYQNARQLIDQDTDSAAVVIEHGHRAGLEVFLSLRFNDGHDSRLAGGIDDPDLAPLKRRHPEWLLGEPGFGRFAYNFALPEVRQYRTALIREAIANYDLDRLDLDFCRQPTLLISTARSNSAPSPRGTGRPARTGSSSGTSIS
jgi:hypothetical protein